MLKAIPFSKRSASEMSPSLNSSTIPPRSTKSASDLRPAVLSPSQKALLRASWQKVGKNGSGSIGAMIFKKIFTKCPAARKMFGFGATPTSQLQHDSRFNRHAALFVRVLNETIKSLDDLEVGYAQKLIEYGRSHTRLMENGFDPKFWDVFAEAMTESAMEWVGLGAGGRPRDTMKAWVTLLSFIVDRMRIGFEKELRQSKRSVQGP